MNNKGFAVTTVVFFSVGIIVLGIVGYSLINPSYPLFDIFTEQQSTEVQPAPTTVTEDNVDQVAPSPTVVTQDEKPKGVTRMYDRNTVKVGDTVAGLRVTSVYKDGSQPALSPKIVFAGQVTVTGTFTNRTGEAFSGGQICFRSLTPDSLAALPQEIEDERMEWFCLNQPQAITSLGAIGSTGTATIVIDNYEEVFFEGEGWNKADLVKVISLSLDN